MTTRLDLYNDALLLVGDSFLASLAEEREPRRLLDQVWDSGGVRACLEKAQWPFAMRSTRKEPDPSVAPDWGFRLAFSKGEDWVQTSAVCQDEFFKVPLLNYADEGAGATGYWYADIEPIFVKFVSDGAAYGGNLAVWPASFADYAAAFFAGRILPKMPGDKAEAAKRLYGPPGYPEKGEIMMRLHAAKNAAAVGQPTQFPATGNWVRSRFGPRGFRDGGNRGSLIG